MIYEAVVAGGGVMGMAAAYSLLKRGVGRVLVLEKHTVGHDRAASSDNSKAIRYEYAEQEAYSRMVGRSQDGALLTQLASHEQLGRTMKWDEDLESKILALTSEQISAAFRKHLDPAAVTIVKAGDFKTAGVYQ